MNHKKTPILFFFVVLIYSCEKPIFSKKEFKVSGTLYGIDEKTPLSNKKLLLLGNRYNQNQALKGQYSKSIAETETDDEGYFELIYPKNRKADFVKVVDESGEEFSGVISINENYYQDLCVVDVGYLCIITNNPIGLSPSDTIYILTSGTAVTNNYLIKDFDKEVNIITYPFEELEKLKNISQYNLRSNWSAGVIKWGVGWLDFIEKGYNNISESGYPENHITYHLSGFPFTDTVEIEISK